MHKLIEVLGCLTLICAMLMFIGIFVAVAGALLGFWG